MQNSDNHAISTNLQAALFPHGKPFPSIDRLLAIMMEAAKHHIKDSQKAIKLIGEIMPGSSHHEYCPIAVIELNDSVAITTANDALTCLKNDQPLTFHIWSKSSDEGNFVHKFESEELDKVFITALSIILSESANE